MEGNLEFKEFLEAHKPRSSKSTWSNDIVLAQPGVKDDDTETAEMSMKQENSEAEKKDTIGKPESPKKKLSDLEVKSFRSFFFILKVLPYMCWLHW